MKSGLDLNTARRKIVDFIQRQVEVAGADGAVIGLSGGIDSTVTAYLTVEALGSRRVTALIMPDSRITPEADTRDASAIANELGIRARTIDIAPIHSSFMKFLERNRVAEGNLRARIRMSLLYFQSNLTNSLVVGTGDRSELLLGYYCFDSKTKAVTPYGSKSYHRLKKGDEVFSYDFNLARPVLSSVSDIHTFDYHGMTVQFLSDSCDLLVTPNHRMLARVDSCCFGFFRADKLSREKKLEIQTFDTVDLEKVGVADKSHVYTLLQKGLRSVSSILAERYSGTVWCPEVPPHRNLLVERNGRRSFSGNTKYGDGGVDILPIADLYKSEVRALAEVLGVPRSVIKKKSSPRLWPLQTAEDELGLPYSKIDEILRLHFDERKGSDVVSKLVGSDPERVKLMLSRYRFTSHKRRPPPICRLR
jgi:NH3-dependent NAD+ synthetase